jgi:hypothetical protein
VLHSIKVSAETEETLVELDKALASGELRRSRSGLLDWVLAMLTPARALGGTAALTSIVDSIQDFDRRLLDAGRLIAQAESLK